MKINMKLLLAAAFIVLALPLIFTANAGAGYNGDGALYDGSTHGWTIPPITPGTTGCVADTTKTSRPDCNTVRFPAYTDGASCSASAEFVANKAEWASVCTDGSGNPINLKGLDRNALQCNKLGGTYARACDGKWTDVLDSAGGSTLMECLRCHNSTYQRNSYAARWKDTYVKTGHKNMLRKVTANQPWTGADGVDYHSLEAGTTVDWGTATITGTSFTGARTLYYVYGDWMAPGANGVYDTTSAGTAGYAKYSCASCHATGYIGTNFVTTKQPRLTYPGITSGITGSWDQNGIVCSRCHNAVQPEGTAYTDPFRASLGTGSILTFTTHETANLVNGAARTALCFECHNSTQTSTDPAGQLKTSAAGNGFSGHILGNEFLNSVHAQFTGSKAGIGTQANYASTFAGGSCYIVKTGITSSSGQLVEAMTQDECAAAVTTYAANSYTWTPDTGGSCSTCHDVHQSLVDAVAAPEPMHRECMMCHTDKSKSTTNHPFLTAGTPVGLAGGDNSEACVICHMSTESVEGSTHLAVHLWRINTNASYRTFPTSTEWSAGTKIAFTTADGAYAKAVWVDLDLACGQCHGGSSTTTQHGAPLFNKAQLSGYATGMHSGASPISASLSATYGVDYMTANVTGSSTCPTGCTLPLTTVYDCGGGTYSAGTCTYTTGGQKVITMTVSDASVPAQTVSKAVLFTAIAPVIPPSVGGLACNVTGKTETFTDSSQVGSTVRVTWGDGLSTQQAAGTVFTHTYANAGTYTLTQRAIDSAGTLSAQNQVTCTITAAVAYGGFHGVFTYKGVPTAGVTVQLTDAGGHKYGATTNTLGAFSNQTVPVGTYNVSIFKKMGTLTTTYGGYTNPSPITITAATDLNLGTLNATTP